ncbi:cysteine proteinase [Dendrothele bispora CBS 962.96]|uniref:Cysteine proteinase n=1 Tax=Dendrothele bispora (strain CBS 962.96) TaxID=1314807 RepID=A0A4S8KZQ4_DENBC|nr:cysteine proteinase [Dendrothele bispora CBS 962.96]
MSNIPKSRTDGRLRDGLWIKQLPSGYTPTQIVRWLSKIAFPKPISEEDIPTFETNLENLCILMRLQMVTFPFENTPMHYTSHRTMDISPEAVFQRLVVEGKGCYCFGLNQLFLQMIRGLGYRAYSGAGRINEEPPNAPVIFLSFVHMVIFVQPDENSNITYLVDATGGGTGLTRPILLADGQMVMGATSTETHTLIRTTRSDSSLEPSLGSCENAKVEWHLIVRHQKNSDGPPTERTMYSFIEDEFYPTDYTTANIAVYTKQSGLFWENVVCSKSFWLSDVEMLELMGEDCEEECKNVPPSRRFMGRLGMEGNIVRRHIGSRSDVIRVMNTEAERADALRDIFGIDITQDDLAFMKGRAPAFEGFPKTLENM